MKKRTVFIWILLLLFIVTGAIFAYGIYVSRDLTITSYSMVDGSLPPSFDGYRVVLISDLHGREIGENQALLAQKIMEQEPDIVIIAGDVIDGHDQDSEAIYYLCEKLVPQVDVAWVKGNNFYKADEQLQSDTDQALRKLGVIALDNQHIEIQRGTESITIAGIDDPERLHRSPHTPYEYTGKVNRAIMERYLESVEHDPHSTYSILVSHRPNNYDLFQSAGYNMTLCGHTHGGQIRFPFNLELIGDYKELLPKIQKGYNDIDGMPMIVSSGLGYSSLPIRTFNPPEIVVIELSSEA